MCEVYREENDCSNSCFGGIHQDYNQFYWIQVSEDGAKVKASVAFGTYPPQNPTFLNPIFFGILL